MPNFANFYFIGLSNKPSFVLALLLLKCGLKASKKTTFPPTWHTTFQE